MAQTIKIKRTTGTAKPTNVAQGELFYAYGSNGTYGKRLAIGHLNGAGNTPELIGGSYFMDMLGGTSDISGTLTASSAIVVDQNKHINELSLKAQGEVKFHDSDSSHYASIKAPATIGTSFTLTLPADDGTSGQVLSTNGSGTLSWIAQASTLTIAADSGSNDTVAVGTDTLTFEGTANEIETTVSDNKINIGLPANVTISGNLTVNGDTTTVNTATLSVEDPLIILAKDNAADSVDIGFYGKYVDSSTTKYSGMFRDESDGKFRLFTGNQAAPTTTVDLTGTGYAVASLVANLESSSVTITGGTITGITDLVVQDGGTGAGTFTSNGIIYGNGTGALQATAAGTDGYFLYSNSGTPAWTNTVDGGTYT